MAKKACSDEDFIAIVKKHGNRRAAEIIGVAYRNVLARKANLIASGVMQLTSRNVGTIPQRIPLSIDNGIVIIGSDAHYWPDLISCAHRGMVKLIRELNPKLIIANGDMFDGAKVSRFPSTFGARPPDVKEELETVDERLTEFRDACKDARRIWTRGNHDSRFEMRLADQAAQFEGVKGFALGDHFPEWEICWTIPINEDVIVKHRFKGGIHATHNNTLWSGKTMVTGHLHSLKVTPFTDYNGIRYGVDTGTLADPTGEQFDYAEANPLNHRSGFIILTFHKGKLLWPEIANVLNENEIVFRGNVLSV